MEHLHLYVILGAAAIFLLVLILSRRAAAKRRAELEGLAHQSGWTFSPEDVRPDALNAGPFTTFEHGRAQRAHNVLRGSSPPAEFAVFDYRYTTGSGKSQHTTHQTVVHVRSPRLALPPFVLSQENIFHKIGGLFGYHDIDFEGSPEFSSRYLLRSKESEPYVREFFSPAVRDYFERNGMLTVEGHGDGVLVFRQGKVVKGEEVRMFLESALNIARLFER